MSYVVNATGRSRRRRRCGCGCGADCGCEARSTASSGPYMLYSPTICQCPDGCPQPYRRNVVYAGPCPPCPDDPCQPPLPPPPPDPPCYPPFADPFAYAYYAQTGALSAEAGGPIVMDSIVRESPGAFVSCGGCIRILRPGIYQASFAMTLPAESSLCTRLSMTLDGEELPGSAVQVSKGPGAPGSAQSQTVFRILQPGCVFMVRSDAPFSIAGQPGVTLASLTLTQIGPV